jgi:CHAT domain-containing protein
MAQKWFHKILLLPLLLATFAGASTQGGAAYRQAVLLCNRGDWNAALSYIDAALERAGGIDEDPLWGLRVLRGEALIGHNEAAAAVIALTMKVPARLAHSEIEILRLTYLASATYRLKDYPAAERLLIRAERLGRAYRPRVLGEVLLYRASLEYARKDLSEAIRYGRVAAKEAHRNGQTLIEIKALGTLGLVRTKQQRYDEAIELFLRQLTLARSSGAESTVEKLEGNLAWAYECVGDFENASTLLSHAIPLATQLGAEHDLIAWLELFGDVARMRGDKSAALQYYARGLAIARRTTHRDLVDFVGNVAGAEFEAGDVRAAAATNDEASAIARTQKDQEQMLRALLLDARIDAASGRLDSGVEKAQRVLDSAKDLPQRWEAEARLAQFHIAANRTSEAEVHFRRAIDTAYEARREVKSDELRLPFGALVREVYDDYVSFLLASGRATDALAIAEVSRVQTLADALNDGVRPRPIDTTRLARDRHAVLLSYWLTPARSYVWVITSSAVRFAELPSSYAIEQKLNSYSQKIISMRAREGDRAEGGAELYTMLVGPISEWIPKGAHVIVVPDGCLHAFNMETLIVPSSRHYWIDDVTLETTGSLGLLDRAQTSARPRSMLLIGDPPSPDREFPRLVNAVDEIARVKKHFATTTVLEGSRATPRAYENADAGHYELIHFVAHGFATRMRPLESAVVLASDGNSYKLYARDIIKQKLHARLVTISSCHGAGTRAYTGEGLVGVSWAFLHAGAHQVIAALWEVNDSATPTLMDDLYGGIRTGQDPATGLRNAKLNLIHGGSVFRQPRYWAPFVLYSGS